jgi:glycosyltransferase involved in cell wall biosynthesis
MAAPQPTPPAMVSVVVTVRNEARHLAALLDSLLQQEPPFEVLIIDSNSEDGTLAIARDYEARHPGVVRAILMGGTRGASRNHGVGLARGEAVAFIDGDCVATPGWLAALRRGLAQAGIAAGQTEQVGWSAFESLERVELQHKGYDVTYPSCNLAYRKALFQGLGGFDPWFRTAEDIDLNFRAVDQGAHIVFVPGAVVFHRTRSTVWRFLKQALWNGYGRKQLTLKHGKLWSRYSLRRMLTTQVRFWALVRLAAALVGYLLAKLREPRDRRSHAYAPPVSSAEGSASAAPEEAPVAEAGRTRRAGTGTPRRP